MGYDLNTKNKSFIKMREYLQDNNIENNLFMLETKDNDLIGIDIYDKLIHLEGEDRYLFLRKVLDECKENIWFYFREIVHIPNILAYTNDTATYENGGMFILNQYFMDIIYTYSKGVDVYFQSSYYTCSEIILLLLYQYENFVKNEITTPCKYITTNKNYMDRYSYLFNLLYINCEMIPSMCDLLNNYNLSTYDDDKKIKPKNNKKLFLDSFEYINNPLYNLLHIPENVQIVISSMMNPDIYDEFVSYLKCKCPKFTIDLYDNINKLGDYKRYNIMVYINYTSGRLGSIIPVKGYGTVDPNILSNR